MTTTEGGRASQLPALLTEADVDAGVAGEPRIRDLRLAEALGFRQAADIRKLISRHRQALEQLGVMVEFKDASKGKGGRPTKGWALNKKQALFICTKSETSKATDITLQIVDVFDAVINGRQALVLSRADMLRQQIADEVMELPPELQLEAAAFIRSVAEGNPLDPGYLSRAARHLFNGSRTRSPRIAQCLLAKPETKGEQSDTVPMLMEMRSPASNDLPEINAETLVTLEMSQVIRDGDLYALKSISGEIIYAELHHRPDGLIAMYKRELIGLKDPAEVGIIGRVVKVAKL